MRTTSTKLNLNCSRLKSHLINTRNAQVMERLQRIYQTKLSGGHLNVFCVSNTDYWTHRDKRKNQALPYLHLSGILNLRRHCISIVAQSQLRAAKSYIEDELPALLRSIELWVQSGSGGIDAERRRAIRDGVGRINSQLQAVREQTL